MDETAAGSERPEDANSIWLPGSGKDPPSPCPVPAGALPPLPDIIQHAERQKGSILNSLQHVLIECISPDMRVLWANQARADDYGVPLDQVIGHVCYKIRHQRETPCPDCLTVDTLRTGQSQQREFVSPIGRVFLSYASPLCNEAGQMLGAVNVAVDITQRKQTEQDLSLAQQRLQRIVESNVLGIIVGDARGTILEANDYFLRLLGGTRDELQAGKIRWTDMIPPEHLATTFQAMAEARQKGACTPYEKECRRRDGRRIPILVGLASLPGNQEHFVAFVLDITQRKQAEQALRESEERFRGWFNQAAVGAALLDADGRLLVVNQLACDITGYSEKDMLDRTFLDLTHPEDCEVERKKFRQLMAGQIQTYTMQKRNVRRDGQIVWVNVSKTALRNASGELTGCIAIIEDITDRRKAEEALRASEAQFLQAQKMEAIGLLAGGIAHDFRNQLTVIKGYSEMLLRRGMVSGPAREYVEEILQAASRSASLTGERLAFSRKVVLHPEVIDLNATIQEIAKTIRSILGEDVSLSIVPGLDLHAVRIDPGPFQQALVNLAINARDAMPNGGQFTIETANVQVERMFQERHPDAVCGPHVAVTVRDNGIGMDKDTLERIFEPFFTTKPMGRGTGLGLSMVYGFVRQSGGQIEVASQPGRGTTFRLYFQCECTWPREASVRIGQADLVPGTGTILLAEDDAAIRRMTLRTLQECGYTVLEAGDGQQALDLSRTYGRKIDLLVADVVMPGMDGHELALTIKRERPEIKVLYMSGYTGNALAQRGILQENTNLLVKPFDTHQIANIIGRLLEGRHPSRRPV